MKLTATIPCLIALWQLTPLHFMQTAGLTGWTCCFLLSCLGPVLWGVLPDEPSRVLQQLEELNISDNKGVCCNRHTTIWAWYWLFWNSNKLRKLCIQNTGWYLIALSLWAPSLQHLVQSLLHGRWQRADHLSCWCERAWPEGFTHAVITVLPCSAPSPLQTTATTATAIVAIAFAQAWQLAALCPDVWNYNVLHVTAAFRFCKSGARAGAPLPAKVWLCSELAMHQARPPCWCC